MNKISNFAIIQILGLQYIIKSNYLYNINKIKNKNKNYLLINKILFLKINNKIQIGKPFLKNIQILSNIIQNIKKKNFNFKNKKKKKYMRMYGFRPIYTRIKIN